MTQALDAATAACRIILEIHHKRTAEDFALAALRAALPAEPPAELIEAIAEAEDDEDVYRAVRAHILGEDA